MKQKLPILMFLLLSFSIVSKDSSWNEKRIVLYDRQGIVEIARKYIGTPYKAGGSSPNGFDCSGFTMYVYKKAGYKLPRTTRQQYMELIPIQVPRPGDLVFFRIYRNQVSHVGIYLGNFKFIHAPRTGKSVEITDIRKSYWKKHYAGSRTYFLK